MVRAFGRCWIGAAACARVAPLGCRAWESSNPEKEPCTDWSRCTSERRKPNPMLAHGSRRHEAAPAHGRRMTPMHHIATRMPLAVGASTVDSGEVCGSQGLSAENRASLTDGGDTLAVDVPLTRPAGACWGLHGLPRWPGGRAHPEKRLMRRERDSALPCTPHTSTGRIADEHLCCRCEWSDRPATDRRIGSPRSHGHGHVPRQGQDAAARRHGGDGPPL